MKVRAARIEDVPALAEIAERSYRSAFASILEPEVLAGRDAVFFTARFASSWERMLVAVANDRLMGFLLMTDGHIDMLFMAPEASQQGGGALLLHEAEALGATSLECFRDNAGARRFYERHGWHVGREYKRVFVGRERSFVWYVKG